MKRKDIYISPYNDLLYRIDNISGYNNEVSLLCFSKSYCNWRYDKLTHMKIYQFENYIVSNKLRLTNDYKVFIYNVVSKEDLTNSVENMIT